MRVVSPSEWPVEPIGGFPWILNFLSSSCLSSHSTSLLLRAEAWCLASCDCLVADLPAPMGRTDEIRSTESI